MNDAVVNEKPLCATAGSNIPPVKAVYPRVRWGTVSYDQFEPADKLNALECSGLVTNNLDYRSYRRNASFCQFDIAEVISPSLGGWVTNKESRCACVRPTHSEEREPLNRL